MLLILDICCYALLTGYIWGARVYFALQPTLLECSAQFLAFFLFSRSSRQLGAEIGQQARAVWPQDWPAWGWGWCWSWGQPAMAWLFAFECPHNNEQGVGWDRGLQCKGWGLFASGLICDFGSCVCVRMSLCVCVASWLNCGSSFRFCGSHNLCALYALPKSWLGLRQHSGALRLHLELGVVAAVAVMQCACVCVRAGRQRRRLGGALTLSSESCARFEWRQLRVATGSIAFGAEQLAKSQAL